MRTLNISDPGPNHKLGFYVLQVFVVWGMPCLVGFATESFVHWNYPPSQVELTRLQIIEASLAVGVGAFTGWLVGRRRSKFGRTAVWVWLPSVILPCIWLLPNLLCCGWESAWHTFFYYRGITIDDALIGAPLLTYPAVCASAYSLCALLTRRNLAINSEPLMPVK
jgi:hypothetical protein